MRAIRDVEAAKDALTAHMNRLRQLLQLVDREQHGLDGLDVDQTVNALIRSREN